MTFSSSGRRGCALAGQQDASYQARFKGPVTVDRTKHDLVVTHDGSPLSGMALCVNTEMIGMSGMGYSDKGREVAPGRYQFGFRFGMAGTYRGNAVVDSKGNEISIPMTFTVAPPAP
ncbi:MAG: FixH family protein [Solirubrobacteraceae bacterium]